jgi:hypothetical protein
MRVPVAIQSAEARGRQRFVDWCERIEPWIALGHRTCETRELLRKLRIEQARIARAASVMHESYNRTNAELAQSAEALVCPAPINRIQRVGRELFPQNRITQRPNAE